MKTFFTVTLILVLSTSFAQNIVMFDAASRTNTEGIILISQLNEKIINSNKAFIFRVEQKPLPHIRTIAVSFLHANQVYTIDLQNDLSRGGSFVHNSFLRIAVHPKGRPQEEIFFTDHLLNGSWDEQGTPFITYLYDDFNKEQDEALQKKFIKIIKSVLEYLE